MIRNSTPPKQLGKAAVLDLFCGSGTAIIAAEQLGRKCYGMEKDPVYCDVIVKRWEQFTGGKAELLRGGEGEGVAVQAENFSGVVPVQAAG